MRGQAEVTVKVGAEGNGGSFSFSPPALHIDNGTTVNFEWADDNDSVHSVRHENGAFDFGSPISAPGIHFTIVCETDGQYRYYCPPHKTLNMKGAIIVGSSQQPVTDSNAVTVNPTILTESAKLAATDGSEGDYFGAAVSVSSDGQRVLVGAHRDGDPYGIESGSAYVFRQTATGWQQEMKLVAADGETEDWFGWDVTLNSDGSVALVSAYFEGKLRGPESGAVYAFTRTGNDWQQEAKFTAKDTDEGDRFGSSVELTDRGDTGIIGAWRAGKSQTGAAYVFNRNGTDWEQASRLTSDTPSQVSAFGRAVTLTGDGSLALIGDPNEGAAYVFERDGGTWREQAQVTSPVQREDDRFGGAVALADNGETAFIGTSQPMGATKSGYAAVYNNDTGWTHETTLHPENGYPGDTFGSALAIAGNGEKAIVGASNSNAYGENAGAATLYARTENGWEPQKSLKGNDTETYDDFGITVTMSTDGSTGVLGARNEESPNGDDSGAAYVFDELPD